MEKIKVLKVKPSQVLDSKPEEMMRITKCAKCGRPAKIWTGNVIGAYKDEDGIYYEVPIIAGWCSDAHCADSIFDNKGTAGPYDRRTMGSLVLNSDYTK